MPLDMLLELADLFSDGSVSEVLSAIAAITVIILLVNCFFGYKLLKIYITLMGFIIGIGLSGVLALFMVPEGSSDGGAVIISLLALCIPILCAWLAFKIYQIGIFIYCGILPGLIGWFVTESSIGALVLFVLFGTLGVILTRPFIIASTAIPSGLSAGPILLSIFEIDNTGAGILLGAAFAVAGVIVQWMTTGSPSAAKGPGYVPQDPGVPPVQTPPPASGPQFVSSSEFMNPPEPTEPPEPVSAKPVRFCRNCGSRLDPEDTFCEVCGAKPDAPADSQTVV